jgi:citrate lyase synthetase
VVLAQKAIAACGTTPENVAKVIMIQNTLSKRGAQSRHIAEAMRHQADMDSKRAEVSQKIMA